MNPDQHFELTREAPRQSHSALNSSTQGLVEIANQGYVIGADIGGTNLRLACADMDGAIVSRWSASTQGIRDPKAVVELIEEGVEHMLKQTSIPRTSLRAFAAGAPGLTNVDEGIVIATSYLLGWRDVGFRALLESALNVPAAIENDVNLAAIAESRVGQAQGTPDFVFLAIGTGLGAGIVLNNRLFQGSAWAAGEIGYMLVPGISSEPAKQGEPGGLESLVGGEGIRLHWQSLWRESTTPLPKDLKATEIFDHALAGDALAQIVLNKSAQVLAYAIYNIWLILNCPLVIMGGSVGMNSALCSATQNFLDQRNVRAGIRLVQSTLGVDAQIIGAVQLALDTAEIRLSLASS
jgi:glucokinase